MMIFPLLASVLLAAAIALFLDLTPQRIADDLSRLINRKPTIKNKVKLAKKKKKGRIADSFNKIQMSLSAMGKGGQFAIVCTLSLVLLIAGGTLAAMIGNLLLIPILAVSMAGIPFLYIRSNLAAYMKHIDEELETALSVITTPYSRTGDVISAIRENITGLKPPGQGIFRYFLWQTTAVSADIRAAILDLKKQIDNEIYRDWCDCLLQCQEDKTLIPALSDVVKRLSDVRVTNNELRTLTEQPKKEYWTMVGLLIANIPLLFIINQDWFMGLVQTTAGKITLAVTALVIVITAVFLQKFTKPIEIKR